MFKTSFYYTIEKLSPRILSVIILPVILRLIKPELWAEITLLLAIQLLFSLLITQGDENSILKFSSNEEFLVKAISSVIKFGILSFVLFEVLGQIYNDLPFSINYGLPFRFMFISTLFLSINKLFIAKLKSMEKAKETFKSAVFESIFINFGQLILIALTVRLEGGYNTRVIVTSYFLIQMIGYFFKLLYFKKILNFKFQKLKLLNSEKKPVELVNFSSLSFAMLVSAYFLNWQDRFFVEKIFGLNELGIYSVSLRISNLGLIFVVAILTSAYAKYWPKKNNKVNDKSVNLVTSDLMIISTMIFSSIALISSSIGKYVIPESYFNSVEIIYLATTTLFLQSIVYIFTIDFGRKDKLRIVVLFNCSVFLSQVIFYLNYNFEGLEEVFQLRSYSLFIFIILFFGKSASSHIQTFTVSIVTIVITNFLIITFLEDGTQYIQIINFLLGLACLFICLNKWIKLDTE